MFKLYRLGVGSRVDGRRRLFMLTLLACGGSESVGAGPRFTGQLLKFQPGSRGPK